MEWVIWVILLHKYHISINTYVLFSPPGKKSSTLQETGNLNVCVCVYTFARVTIPKVYSTTVILTAALYVNIAINLRLQLKA